MTLLRSPMALVLLLGMAIRLVWAFVVPVIPVSDQIAYETFAQTLVAHGVHGWSATEPTAYWAPGTAALHAAAFWAFGKSGAVVVGVNLACSALIIVAGCRLGARWFGARAGTASGLLLAIWPNLVMFTTTLSSELPFIALCLSGFLLWDGLRHARWLWPLTGVIWAAAMLLRPVIQLLPLALALGALMRRGRGGAWAVLQAAVILAVMLAVVQPWAWRNATVLQSEARISTNFGPNLWMGNNPDGTGGYMDLPADVAHLSEAARDTTLRDRALDYMMQDPWHTLLRSTQKFLRLHDRETIGVAWNDAGLRQSLGPWALAPLKLLATGFWYAILLAALAGLVLLGLRDGLLRALAHPALCSWGYFSLLHAVVVVEDRYHMPGGVFLVFLAGWVLEASLRPARPRHEETE